MPSITREKTEMELRYEEVKDAMREERSRLSDFELDEAKHHEMKKERERRALEEDIDTAQVCNHDIHILPNLFSLPPPSPFSFRLRVLMNLRSSRKPGRWSFSPSTQHHGRPKLTKPGI